MVTQWVENNEEHFEELSDQEDEVFVLFVKVPSTVGKISRSLFIFMNYKAILSWPRNRYVRRLPFVSYWILKFFPSALKNDPKVSEWSLNFMLVFHMGNFRKSCLMLVSRRIWQLEWHNFSLSLLISFRFVEDWWYTVFHSLMEWIHRLIRRFTWHLKSCETFHVPQILAKQLNVPC